MHTGAEKEFSYISKPHEIVRELIQSKQTGNVIGISALSLGPGMIMTAVDEIIDTWNDKLIILKETDLLGIKLPEVNIFLSEIVQIHPFRTNFYDPFHVRLREMKRNDPA